MRHIARANIIWIDCL